MRTITDRAGLSLGDRFCLAQARRSGAAALTADRSWRVLAAPLGVEVELIR
jgi:PIN domain nuclease of toxin-antitoxin system